ncbi:hypothetical protein PHET_02823 [Paragonimus heterotremus]|uniref:Coiled-coil domain-containing protein 108 n=1 Tax=Paragonimus heterotremus TaxID=100268 RepID=A0A8J4SRS9_9TREM|nr:hypothetical protein PHET_02823 [Paragonimus heterotremus]
MNRPTSISNKQIQVDGLAFDKEIIWENWKPGITYLKYITVHNCSAKVKECNYSLPDSADFQMVYPRKWKKIAAGSVFRLPILFKPTEEKVYESHITLRIKDQKRVQIGLRAILPEVNISVPTKLDFGPVGVDDTKTQIFTIRNMSNLETSFTFQLAAPFHINTLSGILMPMEKRMVEMTFSPTESGVYEQEAYCTYGPESGRCVTMHLSGIGEYPGLKFSLDDSAENDDRFRAGKELELHFPVIASGSVTTKFLKVANRSKINATLSIKSLSKDAGFEAGCLFSTTICQSVIRPQTELEIPFSYQPCFPGTQNIAYYKLVTSNYCGEVILKCHGNSSDTNVKLSTNALNFGLVRLGQATQRFFFIENQCDQSTVFQLTASLIQTDRQMQNKRCASIFPVLDGPMNGILVPHQRIRLIMGFVPSYAGHFYRRITLLVANQLYTPSVSVEPSYIDFTENNSDVQRSLKCTAHHLNALRLGLEHMEPRQGIPRTFVVQNHTKKAMRIQWSPLRDVPSPVTSGPTLSENVMENPVPDKSTTLETFTIEPITAEVASGKSCQFTVTFLPTKMDQFYSTELEGFATFLSQKDYSLCQEEEIRPPSCLLVNCFGHTFSTEKEPHLPHFTMSKNRIRFPAMELGEVQFETITLSNQSDRSLFVQHLTHQITTSDEPDRIQPINRVLQLIPPTMLIPPESQAILVFRCDSSYLATKPLSDIPIDSVLMERLSFNCRPEYELTMPMEITISRPALMLESNGELYFPPTQVNAKTRRRFGVTNITTFVISFRWHILTCDQTLLQVEPSEGVIRPNEIQHHIWTFSPSSACERVFTSKLTYRRCEQTALVQQAGSAADESRHLKLRVVAFAEPVFVRVEPEVFNCGSVMIGATVTCELQLHNLSQASTYFSVCAQQPIEREVNSLDYEDNENSVMSAATAAAYVLPRDGWVAGLSSMSIVVTLKPTRSGPQRFQLCYQLWTPKLYVCSPHDALTTDVERTILTEYVPSATILLTASYPTLRITDIQGLGTLGNLGAVELWRDLALDYLNSSLAASPSKEELRDSIATRTTYRDHPHGNKDRGPVFDMFLGVATTCQNDQDDDCTWYETCEETQLYVLFENTGLVNVDLAFLFPSDLLDKLPTWADDGQYSNDELHYLRVEADRLFSIEPKRAFLEPSEVVQVCITFRHQLPGTYQLPVLLKVEGGREIKLRFLGLTLPRNQPYLHFAQRRHVFPAVALSDGDNRFGYLYSLQFRNPSARPVRFNIGPLMWPQNSDHPCSSAMLEGTVEGVTDGVGGCEFDMPVLYCCTLQGIVLPGEVFKLDWRFRPMEAKTYTALCPVHISDASISCAQPEGENSQYEDTILLELVAIAYDLRQLERPHVPANPHRVRLPTANEQHILKVPTFPDSFLMSGEHCAQPMPRRIRLPGYPVSLSHHLLDLGRIAFGARARRLIHLVYSNTEENAHLPHSRVSRSVPSAYRFILCTRVPDDIQFIDIKPNCGKIYPGQTVQLELTLTATSMPRFVDIQLQCQLFDEDREFEYNQELKSWQRELERQQVEFVIAHPNKVQRRPPQFTESAASFLKQDQGLNELDPQRTTELILSDRVWPKPSPPLPTLLHVTVTAHLVGQNETQHDRTSTLVKQFRDSTLFLHPAHSLSNVLTRTGYQEELTQTQWVLCSDILSTILSGLLDDVEFVEHIRETACPHISQINGEQSTLDQPDDPVPYWTQLKQPVKQSVTAMESDRPSNDKTSNGELETISKDQIMETLHRFQPNVSVPWLKGNPQVDNQSEQMTEVEMESKCMRSPAFHTLVEDTLAGMLHNILAEAMKNEVDLTARFRAIALPPCEHEPTT